MILRADHVAGAAFVVFGIAVIALSGDLPTGQLSMPGSGFMPKIVAVLTILFGLVLLVRARESVPFSQLSWSDGRHAGMVIAAAAAATALYTVLGFIITMLLMLLAVLVLVERRSPLRAGAYSLFVVLVAYVTFEYLLGTPLPTSPFSSY
jgi:uncharacterized membrane protein